MKENEVIKNIIQIRNLQGITKRSMAEALDINEASYGRIESGKIALAYSMLAKIASVFNLSVVDVITYPDKFEKANNIRIRQYIKKSQRWHYYITIKSHTSHVGPAHFQQSR